MTLPEDIRPVQSWKGVELHKVYRFISQLLSCKLGCMAWDLVIEIDHFKEIYDRDQVYGMKLMTFENQFWIVLLCFSSASTVFSELFLNGL